MNARNILGRPDPETLHAATLKALGFTPATTERIGAVIHDALGAVDRQGHANHPVRLNAAELALRLQDAFPRAAASSAARGPLKVEVSMPQWLRTIRQDGARLDSHSNAPNVNRQLNSGSQHAAPSDGDRMETGT